MYTCFMLWCTQSTLGTSKTLSEKGREGDGVGSDGQLVLAELVRVKEAVAYLCCSQCCCKQQLFHGLRHTGGIYPHHLNDVGAESSIQSPLYPGLRCTSRQLTQGVRYCNLYGLFFMDDLSCRDFYYGTVTRPLNGQIPDHVRIIGQFQLLTRHQTFNVEQLQVENSGRSQAEAL